MSSQINNNKLNELVQRLEAMNNDAVASAAAATARGLMGLAELVTAGAHFSINISNTQAVDQNNPSTLASDGVENLKKAGIDVSQLGLGALTQQLGITADDVDPIINVTKLLYTVINQMKNGGFLKKLKDFNQMILMITRFLGGNNNVAHVD